MVKAENYAAAIQLALDLSKELVPSGKFLDYHGWPHSENEYYWSVRESVLATCRSRGIRFSDVISKLSSISSCWGYEEGMKRLRELAEPVWGEVGCLLLIHDLHSQ